MFVQPGSEQCSSRADRKVGPTLGRGRIGIGMQLHRSAKGHAHVSRTNVVNVAGVGAGAGGIDVMHDAVKSSRFAPPLISPKRGIVVHVGKVANTATPGAAEARAGVGVGPGIAAIGGSVDEVIAGVRKAAAAFVHASDVHGAGGIVAGDLDVADKLVTGMNLSRVSPSKTVCGGVF